MPSGILGADFWGTWLFLTRPQAVEVFTAVDVERFPPAELPGSGVQEVLSRLVVVIVVGWVGGEESPGGLVVSCIHDPSVLFLHT